MRLCEVKTTKANNTYYKKKLKLTLMLYVKLHNYFQIKFVIYLILLKLICVAYKY